MQINVGRTLMFQTESEAKYRPPETVCIYDNAASWFSLHPHLYVFLLYSVLSGRTGIE
jgi:hypothetical protein